MEAVRCTECAETRWSLFPGSHAHALDEPCELCGGEMVIERRRPGAGPDHLSVERRRAAIIEQIGAGSASQVGAR